MFSFRMLFSLTLFILAGRLDALTVREGMPAIVSLDAKCGRSGMSVQIQFDQPFPGVIYSKGHYSDSKCHYVSEKNSVSSEYTFVIPVNKCGTQGQLEDPTPTRDMYFENTIIIQTDPLITEVWDEARILKCIWPHTLLRQVHSTPISVQGPNRVSVELDERSVNTLMDIQKGSGPFTSPTSGYVYMGEDTSVVMYVHDSAKAMDVNVVNCTASILGGPTEQLIDDFGCLARPDLMTYFDKTRTSNGVKADLMLYSYLKGFPQGDNTKFQVRCQLETCHKKCSVPCTNGPVYAQKRRRRSVSTQEETPSGHIDEAILIIEKEQLNIPVPQCALSKSVLISGILLLSIVALLSLLSCHLAVRLSKASNKW